MSIKTINLMFRLDQAIVNGFTYISPRPMLEKKQKNLTHNARDLQTLQNGELKYGLSDKLSIFQEKLDLLGKLHSFIFNSCILAKELIREWTIALISILTISRLHNIILCN